TDGCMHRCTAVSCGDGVVWSGHEQCDDGAKNSDSLADACRTSCKAASCGDAVKDTGEACDDGNASSTDGCLPTCKAASCGDGVGSEEHREGNEGAEEGD